MELVVAGQDAEKLPGLKVTEAHDAPGGGNRQYGPAMQPQAPARHPRAPPSAPRAHSQGLLGLVALRVEAVGWEVLDVCFGESPWLGLPQPLS